MLSLSIPSPSEGVWMIGPLPLRAYAIAILIGIVVAWWVLEKRYRRKGGPAEVSLDVAVWMVVFGIVGARLYHIFTTPDPYFGENGDLTKIFRVWEGGLGIWGAVALGAVGAWIGLKRRGLRIAPFADALAPGMLLAQAIGRLGNYFNQELYGKPTDLPWGLEIDPENIVGGYPDGTLFHPTFLYELIWCLIGAVALVALERKFNFRGGQTFWAYIMIYTLGRVWIENLRIDEAEMVLGLRLNVWTSIIIFALAAVMFAWRTKVVRERDDADDIYLPGHGPQTDADADSADSAASAESASSAEGATATSADSPTESSDSDNSEAEAFGESDRSAKNAARHRASSATRAESKDENTETEK